MPSFLPTVRRLSLRQMCALALLLQLPACALVPPKAVVTGELTAAPPAPAAPQRTANGAIYQAGWRGNQPLFEDRRPRAVGDIVTILIRERTNAAKNVSTASSRSGSAKLGVSAASRLLPPVLDGKQNLDMEGSNDAQGSGSSRADNTFTGTLTATVIEVLPNGNLRVAGDKQMAINRGSEHVRFSGVVDPRNITGAGTVLSTQVADARIELRSHGRMDEVQEMGWLQRFFLNISPF